MTDRYMRVGVAKKLQPARGRLRFWFLLPANLGTEGRMSTEAEGEKGPVRFHLIIGEADGQWQIDSIWWRYADQVSSPGG